MAAGRRGWRALGLFWLAVMLVAAGIAGWLAWLGPPRRQAARAPHKAVAVAAGVGAKVTAHPAPPMAALLTPAPDFPGAFLPRVGANGLTPRVAYAGRPVAGTGPRLGLVLAGIGLSAEVSQAAMTELPGAVDMALSAYAADPQGTLRAAREAGHETLQSLPMEPANFPADEEGSRALLTGASPAENARNLEWVLSRAQGYAGVTGASDGQVGAGYAAFPGLMAMLLHEVTGRGLFYLDPRPGAVAATAVGERSADVVIDPTVDDAAVVAGKLARLRGLALKDGSAIGIVLRPDPIVLAALRDFIAGLKKDGIVLTPVSSLVAG